MAYTKKGWKNKGETGATESNSKLDKNAMNDLEKRIADGFEFKNVTQDNTNLNDYVTTGFYFFDVSKTPQNIPIGSNGWLQVIKGAGTFVKQIWYRAGTKNTNDFETYIRTKTDTWSEWKKVLIEGDTLTKKIYFNNNNEFDAIEKDRIINGKNYKLKIGLMNRNSKGSVALQLIDPTTNTVLSQLDVSEDYTRTIPLLVDDSKSDFLALRKDRTIGSDKYYANFGIASNAAAFIELYKNNVQVGRFDVMPNGTIRNGKTGQTLIEGDSGWQNIPLASGITVGSLMKKAQYRKIGKIVQVRGDVAGITKGGVTIGNLPAGYRPSTQIYTINACSGTRFCRLYCDTAGKIGFEWVNDGTYSLPWYTINMVFMVD